MSQPDSINASTSTSTSTTSVDASLGSDARFDDALRRVSFEPGMMLGVAATRAEQDYHRRRATRHAYWQHGSGTVVGLRVDKQGDDPGDDTTTARTRLLVTPGVGVDGLGREVSVYEPYSIDLGAWLTTQHADVDAWGALIENGYDTASNALWLQVTMRYQDAPSGLQPRLATEINAGTDPVGPSRVADGVLYELVAARPADASQRAHPFAAHAGLPAFADLAAGLAPDEQARLAAASGAARAQLELGARLLHALGDDNQALATRETFSRGAAELARTLLAWVAIRLTDGRDLVVNPRRVTVDNLARPFLFNASALAQLLR
ncbi:MAG: hypothetical protein RLZZ584_3027 [Pseudomonadota bacterium]